MQYFYQTKGYTLAEVTVTIVIVATMMATALPRMTAAVNRGRNIEAENMLLAIFSAQQDYRRENGAFTTNEADLDITGIDTMKHFDLVDIRPGTSAGCIVNGLGEVESTSSSDAYELWVDTNGAIFCKAGATCAPSICRKMGF